MLTHPLQPQQTFLAVCCPTAPPVYTQLIPVPSSLQGGRRGASLGVLGCHPALTDPGEVTRLFWQGWHQSTVWPQPHILLQLGPGDLAPLGPSLQRG